MVSRTDIGRIRIVNEDRVVIRETAEGKGFAIVADGMGGHQAGDVASQMAIDIIGRELEQSPLPETAERREALLRAVVKTANEQIFTVASERDQYHGMGTTVVVAILHEDQISIGHIGDSRAYRLNGSSFVQLTEDHSLVNELVRSGQITPEEASRHPHRNAVLRALGTEPEVELDVMHLEMVPGDLFLLCSDGLSNMVDDEEIANILRERTDLDALADRLIQEALQAGGGDNVTVVLMREDEEGTRERGDAN